MAEILTPKQAFEKLYGKTLSEREVFEMRENLVGFFELLKKIDDRNKANNNKETTKEL